MADQSPEAEKNKRDVEYVGAPTEFADAEEVPEWVADIAKILFFIPSVLITATTIPFLLVGIVMAGCLCLFLMGALFGIV